MERHVRSNPYELLTNCWGPFYSNKLILIPVWISNEIHYKGWDEITYPSPNFNGATVEVWKWISNFFSLFTGQVITYPCWNYSWTINQSVPNHRKTQDPWTVWVNLGVNAVHGSSMWWGIFSQRSHNTHSMATLRLDSDFTWARNCVLTHWHMGDIVAILKA